MAKLPLHEALDGKTRFSRLVVIGEGEPKRYGSNRHRRAIVQCDCGTVKTVAFLDLKRGTTRSCGCLKSEFATKLCLSRSTHGHARTRRWSPEYRRWMSMKARCGNPKHPHYANYGGRGIQVCERWLHSFESFLADMGTLPSPELTLDRIDNDRGYEPGNVRWADRKTQNQNRRR